MQKLKKAMSRVAIGAFVLLILYMGLKGFVGTTWTSPSEPTSYAIHGADGRTLVMIFLPRGETYIAYTNEKSGQIEVVLTKMRGTPGTHYFWRLWKVEGPGIQGGLFGYRIYPTGAEPVVMETTVLEKAMQGDGTTALPGKGKTTHPVLLFTIDAVQFEGMWLKKEPANAELLSALQERVRVGSK